MAIIFMKGIRPRSGAVVKGIRSRDGTVVKGIRPWGGTAVCRTKSAVRNEQKQTTSIEDMCILHMIKCENR